MKKTLLKSLALAVVGSLCVVGSSLALPLPQLEGGLAISGAFLAVDKNGAETTIPLSTGIDFLGVYSLDKNNFFTINDATGDYASLYGSTGLFTDFQFATVTPTTSVPLWLAGGFSFEMTSIKVVKSGEYGAYDLDIDGWGIMRGPGRADTPGIFNFSAQGANFANFSYSASTAAEPVPEPATMLLFGTGLIGLAGVSRKLRK